MRTKDTAAITIVGWLGLLSMVYTAYSIVSRLLEGKLDNTVLQGWLAGSLTYFLLAALLGYVNRK